MISFDITTMTLLLRDDTISRHFHTRHCYESWLRNSAPCFYDLQNPFWNWIETQFISQFVSQLFLSLRKTSPRCMDTLVWCLTINTYTYIYTCMGGIHINILWYKTFWRFGEGVSFEKISLKFCCGKMWK